MDYLTVEGQARLPASILTVIRICAYKAKDNGTTFSWPTALRESITAKVTSYSWENSAKHLTQRIGTIKSRT